MTAAKRRPCHLVGNALNDVIATAVGARHRDDAVTPRTGGPAGNARLTAWTGLLLLALYLVELVTLVSLRSMISVHILVGTLLVPLVLLKTATTGWRIAAYYLGSDVYRRAGPPPLILRILGPLIVLTGLAVLGSGLALIALGPATFTRIGSIAGFSFDALTIHQASFVAWAVVTALHVLTRTVPAVQLAAGTTAKREKVSGSAGRGGAILVSTAAGVVVGVLVLHLSGDWTSGGGQFRQDGRGGQHAPR
jgi:hypothetical protein